METVESLAAQLDVCSGRVFALRTALDAAMRDQQSVSTALERDYSTWLASSASDAFLGGYEEEAGDVRASLIV